MTQLDPQFLTCPIAHRGLHDGNREIYENSLTAFTTAMKRGLPIELDVQVSGDGKAIVFHDETLDRLTPQSGRVDELPQSELCQIRLNSGERIPSFDELLSFVGGKVPLLVEIKDDAGARETVRAEYLEVIADAAKRYQGTIALMSFNPLAVARLRELAPDLAIGRVTDDFTGGDYPDLSTEVQNALNHIEPEGLDFVSHNWRDLPRIAQLPLPKLCWTVKSPSQEITARKIADNITFEGYDPL